MVTRPSRPPKSPKTCSSTGIPPSGDLMYLTAFGKGILVINSQRVAVDLLQRRSNIYSDRPRNISLNEFLTENLTFVFTRYGELCAIRHCLISTLTPHGNRWRRFRRPTMEGFSKSVVQDYHPIQGREAIMLALALMKSPPMKKHFQRHAWSIVLSINYHLPPVESEEDPVIVGIANHVLRALHEIQPGNRLVEYFPWMRYIPSRCVCRIAYRAVGFLLWCIDSPNGNGMHNAGSPGTRCDMNVFSIKLPTTW